jgi:hypothetical protein
MSGGSYPKFKNDRVGVKEFVCIGESPPQDHPPRLHQYGRGGHDPVSLLRDVVPLRSWIDRSTFEHGNVIGLLLKSTFFSSRVLSGAVS